VVKVIWEDNTYKYPETYKKIYVSGLKVRVGTFVTDPDVRITRGYNPHFNGSIGCIGSLNGLTLLEALQQIPVSLQVANMNSPLNDTVSSYLHREFIQRINEQEKVEGW
jgi:hypothetical protein